MSEPLVHLARLATVGSCRALLSLRTVDYPPPTGRPRIFAANHVSHADFVAIWTALDPETRARTRPVAGGDYWEASAFRSWLIHKVFRGVLVDRDPASTPGSATVGAPADNEVMARLAKPLQAGENLILFPEGTRNRTNEALLRLRSGVYNLLSLVPEAEVVPLWITHMDRILPKGAIVPVPLNCRLTFGPPLRPEPEEDRLVFLGRLSSAILACRENRDGA